MSELGFSIHWTAAQGNVLALILGMILVPLLAWWFARWANRHELYIDPLLPMLLLIVALVTLIIMPLSYLWGAKL